MKKLALSFVFCFCFTITASAQFGQKGWTPYFPAQQSMVGRICTGPKTSPLCTTGTTGNVEVETSGTYISLTTFQKKTLLFKFGEIFNFNNVKVRDIKATNVKVDTVKPEFLAKADRGVTFVYSALRADNVDITITKDSDTNTNPQEIAAKLSTAFPSIPLDTIKGLLPSDTDWTSKDSFVIKISDPNVHFMIQMARIDIKDMKSLLGAEKVRVFGTSTAGQCNYTDNNLVLNQTEPQTCAITVPVPSGNGNEIKMVLEARDGKLFVIHNTPGKTSTVQVEVVENSPGRWINSIGQLIYRYPFETSDNKIKYKEVYLYINAIKDGNSINITRKAGDRNFPTRISYPNSELTLID